MTRLIIWDMRPNTASPVRLRVSRGSAFLEDTFDLVGSSSVVAATEDLFFLREMDSSLGAVARKTPSEVMLLWIGCGLAFFFSFLLLLGERLRE